jgi:hypothetical protein
MDGYKHYIRFDVNNVVILGFSTAFEQPLTDDICVNEDGDRHYNPILINDKMQFIYKVVNGDMAERTQTELDTELAARPPVPPTVDDKINLLTEQSTSLDERTVGMQEIDFYTLDQVNVNNDRAIGMQDIDDYSLSLIMDLQTQLDELKARVQVLEGGV